MLLMIVNSGYYVPLEVGRCVPPIFSYPASFAAISDDGKDFDSSSSSSSTAITTSPSPLPATTATRTPSYCRRRCRSWRSSSTHAAAQSLPDLYCPARCSYHRCCVPPNRRLYKIYHNNKTELTVIIIILMIVHMGRRLAVLFPTAFRLIYRDFLKESPSRKTQFSRDTHEDMSLRPRTLHLTATVQCPQNKRR